MFQVWKSRKNLFQLYLYPPSTYYHSNGNYSVFTIHSLIQLTTILIHRKLQNVQCSHKLLLNYWFRFVKPKSICPSILLYFRFAYMQVGSFWQQQKLKSRRKRKKRWKINKQMYTKSTFLFRFRFSLAFSTNFYDIQFDFVLISNEVNFGLFSFTLVIFRLNKFPCLELTVVW